MGKVMSIKGHGVKGHGVKGHEGLDSNTGDMASGDLDIDEVLISNIYTPNAQLVLMSLDKEVENLGSMFSQGAKYFVVALGQDQYGDFYSQLINDIGELVWIPCAIGHYGVVITTPPIGMQGGMGGNLPILRGGRS